MDQQTDTRRCLSSACNKIHHQLYVIRSHVAASGDEDAALIVEEMEQGLLAPMRRLRKRLAIPYD